MTGEKRSRGRGEAAGAEGEVEVEGVILTWIGSCELGRRVGGGAVLA